MQRYSRLIYQWIFILFVIFLFSGCASTTATTAPAANDPYENFNRAVLTFNLKSDQVFLKPVARWYDSIVPDLISTGISNFFSNLWEPMTILNDLLQGNGLYAVKDSGRFLVNSTFGVFGLFDVASQMNLPHHKEDFGQTLAVWGVPSGPYLMLPFLGPSNIRDMTGLAPEIFYADVTAHVDSPAKYYATGLRLVDTRAARLSTDEVLDLQPDKYLFIRESYLQQRQYQIHDGQPDTDETTISEDALIDNLLGE